MSKLTRQFFNSDAQIEYLNAYNMDFQISVRHLVEFIFRHGDIDNIKKAVPEEAMQEGARIHRMLQKKYEATLNYKSEVALKYCYNTGRYNIYVEGRADGILHEDKISSDIINKDPANRANTPLSEKLNLDILNQNTISEVSNLKNVVNVQAYSHVVIDEIKGTYKKIDHINEPEIEHLAQAKCYAYIYAKENSLPEIGVRITYCGIDSGDIKFFNSVYSYEEIENWFLTLMIEYSRWTDYEYDWTQVRKLSIDRIEFPFCYREGQKKLVAAVYRTIEARKKLYIQAPTGSGKTIATVFPAVKAIGEGKADKLFYLTAKTITRTVAEDTFNLLRDNGLAFKTVTLTAKEKICPYEQCECNPRACSYAKGHLDRINDALYDVISNEQEFTREIIEKYSEKYNVCAFELSLDISLYADGIICDYNYVFDPHVYLRRYFAEGNRGRYLFLVDEAHNLLDRSREMFSADIVREDMLALRNVVGAVDPKLATSLVTCARQMNKLKKTCDTYKLIEDYTEVSKALGRVVTKIEAFLEHNEGVDSYENNTLYSQKNVNADLNNSTGEKIDIDFDDENEAEETQLMTKTVKSNIRKQVLDFYFKAIHFQYIESIRDENYKCYCEKKEDDTFAIKQLCIDPSDNLRNVMLRAESVVLFSATLLPIQYYKGLLGGNPDDFEIYANSVFDAKKRLLCIARDVTSKYTRRSIDEYRRMAEYIKEVVSAQRGNYLVFCPSFAVQKQVLSLYENEFLDPMTERVIAQSERMSEEEREEFLYAFDGGKASNQSDGRGFIEDKLQLLPLENGEIDNLLKNKIVIGFCVLGGIFSEGIDLKGDSLIGAIIIGNGLPGISIERNIMKDFFDEQGFNGFDYAYKIPGLNKVEQAAGRVIRTSDDVGVIALLEERFLESHYGIMFPVEWSDRKVTSIYNVKELVSEFWRQQFGGQMYGYR